MTGRAIADAILALLPASPGWKGIGEVVGSPALPWRSLSVALPRPEGRSDAHAAQSWLVRGRVLVSAATEGSVLNAAGLIADAIEDVRITVAGWTCGPIGIVGDPHPYQADVVVGSTNTRVAVLPVSFELLVSRTA